MNNAAIRRRLQNLTNIYLKGTPKMNSNNIMIKFISWSWKIILAVVVLFVLYTWLVLSWSFSEGERAGYVQKFSNKGWLCKTWEGELAMINMPGTLTEKFIFTVSDDAVAKKINASFGKRVSLVYEQHVGIPSSCFGDTEYFVTEVREVFNDAEAVAK